MAIGNSKSIHLPRANLAMMGSRGLESLTFPAPPLLPLGKILGILRSIVRYPVRRDPAGISKAGSEVCDPYARYQDIENGSLALIEGMRLNEVEEDLRTIPEKEY